MYYDTRRFKEKKKGKGPLFALHPDVLEVDR